MKKIEHKTSFSKSFLHYSDISYCFGKLKILMESKNDQYTGLLARMTFWSIDYRDFIGAELSKN